MFKESKTFLPDDKANLKSYKFGVVGSQSFGFKFLTSKVNVFSSPAFKVCPFNTGAEKMDLPSDLSAMLAKMSNVDFLLELFFAVSSKDAPSSEGFIKTSSILTGSVITSFTGCQIPAGLSP